MSISVDQSYFVTRVWRYLEKTRFNDQSLFVLYFSGGFSVWVRVFVRLVEVSRPCRIFTTHPTSHLGVRTSEVQNFVSPSQPLVRYPISSDVHRVTKSPRREPDVGPLLHSTGWKREGCFPSTFGRRLDNGPGPRSRDQHLSPVTFPVMIGRTPRLHSVQWTTGSLTQVTSWFYRPTVLGVIR